ncbi:N-acetylneuraminate synthase family protein [Clostridiaceae bacterium M8S5]|nr:N-acetylneuraminate synthase family protein [Clostridiaceae bacterium M8S5]
MDFYGGEVIIINTFNIRNRKIGEKQPAFIVAEIGANHNGDIILAKKTIDAAAQCGVDAVKFQTYTGKELVSDYDRIITWGEEGKEMSEKIGEMFDRISLPRKCFNELFEYADKLGLIAFSSPFSIEGLNYLIDECKMCCIKIASSDVNYLDLLRSSAISKNPVMISLGKCTLAEADIAITTLLENGCDKLVIMHCVAQYPSPMEEMNLRIIESLKKIYPECIVGFSDHSLGITATLGAVALGAKVIEKHFTLDKTLVGPDHWFSMNQKDMKNLVTEIRNMESALGHSRKRVMKCEIDERYKSIRSISLVKDINKGERITKNHVKIVRPGYGISPYDKEKIIGLKINRDLRKNTVLKWEHFK